MTNKRMRYRIAQYAEALDHALESKKPEKQRQVIRSFLSLLGRHRQLTRLNRIVRAYERYALKRQGLRKIIVEHAGGSVEKVRNEIDKTFGKKVLVEVVENPSILAGVRLLMDDEILIDASARHQMDKMFKK